MELPSTNLLASFSTSGIFVSGARFATPHMALGPMCPLMCWLLSCWLCCFAVLAYMWQVILGEIPSVRSQCPQSVHAMQQLGHSVILHFLYRPVYSPKCPSSLAWLVANRYKYPTR